MGYISFTTINFKEEDNISDSACQEIPHKKSSSKSQYCPQKFAKYWQYVLNKLGLSCGKLKIEVVLDLN